MPKSSAAFTISLAVLSPSRWPSVLGSPRDFAQRPLPSIISPTCLGSLLCVVELTMIVPRFP